MEMEVSDEPSSYAVDFRAASPEVRFSFIMSESFEILPFYRVEVDSE